MMNKAQKQIQKEANLLVENGAMFLHPAIKLMQYWEKQTPKFLKSLGKAAKALAIIRQEQYFKTFNQAIEEMNPHQAKRLADKELYQPMAEADQSWTENS